MFTRLALVAHHRIGAGVLSVARGERGAGSIVARRAKLLVACE